MITLENFYVWAGLEPMVWFALFVAFSLIDALLTIYALKCGWLKEGNFVLRFVMRYVPAPVALLGIKGMQASLVLGSLQINIAVLPLLVMMYVLVCAWNIWQILRN